ncbi:dihydroorotate dehydrogenase [bacterium]|nr:dihydroorotate dehydrogenase [bacterium]
MIDLGVNIGSVHFKNPILLASGIIGFGEEYQEIIDFENLGGIVTKSISLNPRAGNKPPRIVETPCGMLNSIGLENPGLEKFLNEKVDFLKTIKTNVVVSVAGSSIDDFVEIAKVLEPIEEFKILELNISCPNVKEGGILFGKNPDLTRSVVRRVREVSTKNLWVKLTPNVTNIGNIASIAEEAGADAIALINTFEGMAIDINTFKPKLGNVIGGLSGPAIKPMAIKRVWEVFQTVKIPIVGMGGIFSWKDVVEFLIAGAQIVQIGSSIFNDPLLPIKAITGLSDFLRSHNYSSISEIVGKTKINE